MGQKKGFKLNGSISYRQKSAFIICLSLIFVIFFSSPVFSLILNPMQYTINSPQKGNKYTISFTIINTEPVPYKIKAKLNKNSAYLDDYLNISPSSFDLKPNEKQNIVLTLFIPKNISPETHNLIIDILSFNQKLASFKVKFTIPGEKIENLILTDLKITKKKTNNLIYFNLMMQNKGNVIAHTTPEITIAKENKKISVIGDEINIIIMPFSSYNLSIAFDKSNLSSGNYAAIAKLKYNNKETEEKTASFSIEKQKKSKTRDKDRIIKIKKGSILPINLTIQNPNTGISFYRITYNIPKTDITGIVEGEIRGESKEVNFKVNTSKLGYGTYIVKMEIRKGRNIEDYDYQNITLKVIPKFNNIMLLIAVVFFIALTGFLLYKFIPIAGFNGLFARQNNNAFDSLSKNINSLSNDLDKRKKDIDNISKDIAAFIKSSNEWLYSRYKSDKYAFK